MTTTASDVALHGRHLSEVSASTVGEFIAAVSNSAVDKILLAAGTYYLTSDMCTARGESAVCIDRALTIEAEVPGAVVLNAMGGRRVFEIQSGGTVELIGLNITGGYTSAVQSVCLLNLLQHFLHRPVELTAISLFVGRRSTDQWRYSDDDGLQHLPELSRRWRRSFDQWRYSVNDGLQHLREHSRRCECSLMNLSSIAPH